MTIDDRPRVDPAGGPQARSADTRTTRVVVGVPTFRRPDQLRDLLTQIAHQVRDDVSFPAAVVVADNACDPLTAALVHRTADATGLQIHYREVTERGISHARNALIRAAYDADPAWTHLVMYDDDGRLTPGCLRSLVSTAVAFDADAAGGPVEMGPLEGSTAVLRAYLGSALPSRATGIVPRLNGGQNILLRRDLIERLSDPWFPPRRGLSGGEDYEFFLKAQAAGARFGWSGDAVVSEPLPPHRQTRAAVLRRAFDENAANAQSQLEMFGRRRAWGELATCARWFAMDGAAAVRRPQALRLAKVALGASGVAGRLAGTLGFNPQPYR